MTTYDIVVPEEYEVKSTGEVKTAYYRVGAAWPTKNGGMSCKLPQGIAVTGEFLIFERKPKAADDGAQGSSQEDES